MSRVRLAEKIISDMESGDFYTPLFSGFLEPDFVAATSVESGLCKSSRQDGYARMTGDAVKGDWKFLSISKKGWFWDRKKSVCVMKYDGTDWVFADLTQEEIDTLYSCWERNMPKAIELANWHAQNVRNKAKRDSGWHP